MSIVRKTKSVLKIIAIFNESDSAFSVVDLVSRLKSVMNKTTVYRILERLENNGTLHSFVGTDGLKWYAKCIDISRDKYTSKHTHPHFQCNKCGKVECLEMPIVIPEIENRHIDSANVLITGHCVDCAN